MTYYSSIILQPGSVTEHLRAALQMMVLTALMFKILILFDAETLKESKVIYRFEFLSVNQNLWLF